MIDYLTHPLAPYVAMAIGFVVLIGLDLAAVRARARVRTRRPGRED